MFEYIKRMLWYFMDKPISEIENVELFEKFKVLNQDDLDLELYTACNHGELELVKYLLASPDLRRHANAHADQDSCFRAAYKNKHFDVIKFLIFDMNIEKTEYIEEHLNNHLRSTPEHASTIDDWFEMRELNKNLKKDLKSQKTVGMKVKV